ncbi:MAG: cyclic nucleotide-binding domain-containing protein [Thermodesulfobacteriota bacterium]|nr:cyclic nucleotide-binding domain-containing protein [Thermodesulfobacteriota bacterium]
MVDTKNKIPPLVRLNYDKGELIMKEGDYGISIYKVLKGRVKVFKGSGNSESSLATLGPGEIFGEMIFLTNLFESRSASVRAIDDVQLEVWHPSKLSDEYKKMPPILKYIVSQTLNRLNRMNKIFTKLNKKKVENNEKALKKDPMTSKRKFYRKDFEQTCVYWPIRSSTKTRLKGRITDISMGGIGFNIIAKNILNFSHNPGDVFKMNTTLPSGQTLEFIAKIKTVKKDRPLGHFQLGMEFSKLSGDASKKLGFFLMS